MTGRVEITSQNDGFAVDVDTLEPRRVAATHFNLNDQTLEGIRHLQVPAFSVQYSLGRQDCGERDPHPTEPVTVRSLQEYHG